MSGHDGDVFGGPYAHTIPGEAPSARGRRRAGRRVRERRMQWLQSLSGAAPSGMESPDSEKSNGEAELQHLSDDLIAPVSTVAPAAAHAAAVPLAPSTTKAAQIVLHLLRSSNGMLNTEQFTAANQQLDEASANVVAEGVRLAGGLRRFCQSMLPGVEFTVDKVGRWQMALRPQMTHRPEPGPPSAFGVVSDAPTPAADINDAAVAAALCELLRTDKLSTWKYMSQISKGCGRHIADIVRTRVKQHGGLMRYLRFILPTAHLQMDKAGDYLSATHLPPPGAPIGAVAVAVAPAPGAAPGAGRRMPDPGAPNSHDAVWGPSGTAVPMRMPEPVGPSMIAPPRMGVPMPMDQPPRAWRPPMESAATAAAQMMADPVGAGSYNQGWRSERGVRDPWASGNAGPSTGSVAAGRDPMPAYTGIDWGMRFDLGPLGTAWDAGAATIAPEMERRDEDLLVTVLKSHFSTPQRWSMDSNEWQEELAPIAGTARMNVLAELVARAGDFRTAVQPLLQVLQLVWLGPLLVSRRFLDGSFVQLSHATDVRAAIAAVISSSTVMLDVCMQGGMSGAAAIEDPCIPLILMQGIGSRTVYAIDMARLGANWLATDLTFRALWTDAAVNKLVFHQWGFLAYVRDVLGWKCASVMDISAAYHVVAPSVRKLDAQQNATMTAFDLLSQLAPGMATRDSAEQLAHLLCRSSWRLLLSRPMSPEVCSCLTATLNVMATVYPTLLASQAGETFTSTVEATTWQWVSSFSVPVSPAMSTAATTATSPSSAPGSGASTPKPGTPVPMTADPAGKPMSVAAPAPAALAPAPAASASTTVAIINMQTLQSHDDWQTTEIYRIAQLLPHHVSQLLVKVPATALLTIQQIDLDVDEPVRVWYFDGLKRYRASISSAEPISRALLMDWVSRVPTVIDQRGTMRLQGTLCRVHTRLGTTRELQGVSLRFAHVALEDTLPIASYLSDPRSFLVVGTAGSGKSTVLREVARILGNTGSVLVLDTTGDLQCSDAAAPLLSGTQVIGPTKARLADLLMQTAGATRVDVLVIDDLDKVDIFGAVVELRRKQPHMRVIASVTSRNPVFASVFNVELFMENAHRWRVTDVETSGHSPSLPSSILTLIPFLHVSGDLCLRIMKRAA